MAETSTNRRLTKNEKKRLKKKEVKDSVIDSSSSNDISSSTKENTDENDGLTDIEIEYVSANLNDIIRDEAILMQFKDVFEKFTKAEDLLAKAPESSTAVVTTGSTAVTSEEKNNQLEEAKRLSKKKKKLLSRLTVAQLKQLVNRPDVVEAHDITSSDPRLLVYLKAYRNTVPVPRHWCHVRKYLQGKRGIEKLPFQLPDFIAETGIAKIRDSVLEQEALKKSKQKARDKMQAKTGKIDIDYQVLHDAFFKYQTKPKLTGHGDLYYEGKEFEVHMKEMKPGVLSPELTAALGITDNAPPPWLLNMQRYGPPPSYPSLRIPGLSAPIPAGAQFGFHAGGWGKPPVDEYGRPLYGDVFGVVAATDTFTTEVDKTTRWGEVAAYESEPEEEEEDADEEEEGGEQEEPSYHGGKHDHQGGLDTPSTMDGLSTVNSGMETPDIVDLRKRGSETPDSSAPKELYTVMQERATVGGSKGQLFSSDRAYVLPGRGDVQVSVNPDELESHLKDKDRLQEAYEAGDDDGEGGKRKRRVDSSVAAKRAKEFKF